MQTTSISTHALLAEGDSTSARCPLAVLPFQPTPSLRRATCRRLMLLLHSSYFNPRPPCGGRQAAHPHRAACPHFNPRPPCGGRPRPRPGLLGAVRISTHALLAEGDYCQLPAGFFQGISTHALLAEGDTKTASPLSTRFIFQPTPSLRRATSSDGSSPPSIQRFQPTPSLRRATGRSDGAGAVHFRFQPTPSLRRATANLNNSTNCYLFKFARFVCSSRHMLSLKFQRYP